MSPRQVRFSPELEEAIRALPQNQAYVALGLKYEVGTQVLKILEEKGWSRSDLAKELKKSRQYVTKMLKADTNFTLDSIAALSIALKKEFHFTFTEPGAEAYLWRVIERKAPEQLKREEAMYTTKTTVTLVSMPSFGTPETSCSPDRGMSAQEVLG